MGLHETEIKKLRISNPEDIEIALVQIFLEKNNLKVKKNKFLLEIKSKDSENIEFFKNKLRKNFATLDLNDLVKFFELLIPTSDRKLNGAFFTPENITQFIVKETIKHSDPKICDPSCGCGAFLIQATKYLHTKTKKDLKKILEENIYGVDMADYSIRRCKILLNLLALENEKDINLNLNIIQHDSLNPAWVEQFSDIKKSGGFDVVIGNPPYVKFQDLSLDLRKRLFTNWETLKKGTFNLYFAFFELGMKILNKDGILGYITPNNYFTSLSGHPLRSLFFKEKWIYKILDFNHLKMFDVQTYTCITFLNKKENSSFLYKKIEDKSRFEKLKDRDFSEINLRELNNKKWRLLKSEEHLNIKKIETLPKKLGEIFDIRVGIATCKDSIYFVDGSIEKNGYYSKEYNGKRYLIETNITKPVSKISDFENQFDLDNNKRRIVFPYKRIGNKFEIIPKHELKNSFPKCYSYFLATKKELDSRDKGLVKYPEWYAYARTQGLNFQGRKLLTPTFSYNPRFLFEKSGEALFCNGYAIYEKESEYLPLEAASKILNSKIMDYYIKKTSVSIEGGYPCYQKNFIELFGIPNFNESDLKYLNKENNKDKIDQFLIDKYGLKLV